MTISASRGLYIKLGHGGEWEEQCINEGKLRFGYREIEHETAVEGQWEDVRHQIEKMRFEGKSVDNRVVTTDLGQIQEFYTAGADVLWITFYNDALWWCFAKPEVTLLASRDKTRECLDKWSNQDANGAILSIDSLSGKLTQVQRYQGTICDVKEFEYVLDRINGKFPQYVEDAQKTYDLLINHVESLIRRLHWNDFEVLVDLIVREAGWNRTDRVGTSSQKFLDLRVYYPALREKYGLSVKSSAGITVYKDFVKEIEKLSDQYAKGFFVVHSPDPDLASNHVESEHAKYWGPNEVARLCVEYGLFDWVRNRAG